MPWFPPVMKKTVIVIADDNFTLKGTGVIIGYNEFIHVVTARHVVENISDPTIIFNLKNGKPSNLKTSQITMVTKKTWTYHPNSKIDIACIPFGFPEEADIRTIRPTLFKKYSEVREGEELFFMGFPLGLTSKSKVTPVLRKACLALKLDEQRDFLGATYPDKTMFIDASVSGGNSGSPVFRVPDVVDFGGARISRSEDTHLVGIISGHLTSLIQDFNGTPIARENSGLGIMYPVDNIIETLDAIPT